MAKIEEEFGKWRKEVGKWRKEAEELETASKAANKSMGSYVTALGDAVKLYRNLKLQQRKVEKLEKKAVELRKEAKKIGGKIGDQLEREADLIEDEVKFLKMQNELYEKKIKKQRESLKLHKAIGNTIKDGTWKFAKQIPGYYTEQDKAVRMATLSMGLMGKESEKVFNTINKTAIHTTQMGVNMKGLAKLQQSYSEQLGKTVMLSEQGLTAMAELQEGAFMGDSGIAAEYAANLENFGYSAERARDLMEEGVQLAQGMGVNASKFSKDMVKNLKLAQGYNFKGGLANMKKMTAESIRFKMSMESIAGVADKLITPEGAVEMAANLQVLGGAWSNLADPFTLMYQARHDMEGLQQSIIKATTGTAQFNKETKEFEISGMEMHRLREVAKSLGIDYKELAESSKAFAKNSKIKTMIDPKLSQEAKEFIASNAQWNKDKKGWTINVNGDPKLVKYITSGMENQIIGEKKTLEDRAIASKTFDETLSNLVESLKITLLPFLKGLDAKLTPILKDFVKSISKDGTLTKVAETMKNWGAKVGEFLASFFDGDKGVGGKVTTALLTGLAGFGLFKAGMWLANGAALGMGFNMTASVGGGPGGGPGGVGGISGNKSFMGLSKNSKGRWMQQTKGTNYKTFTKPNILKRAGYGMQNTKWGMGTRMGLGLLGTAGSMGLDYGRQQLEDQHGGWGQAIGVGSSALQGAGMGAMFGPWGALAGGIGGLGYGLYNELNYERPTQYARPNGSITGPNNMVDDFVSRPGEPIQSISPNDTIIGAKKGGPVDKMLDKSTSNETNIKSMDINFKPLKIEFGPITINGTDSKINFNDDPQLLRELSSLIQGELRKAIGGGKLNPNPV